MNKLTRWIVYDGDLEIGWAFSQAGARKIAFEYEDHCVNQDEPYFPEIKISAETCEDNL